MISTKIKLACSGMALVLMTACSSMAPTYTPSPENINRLRDAGLEQTQIGEFTSGGSVEYLTIRGGDLISPYEKSYVNYLKESIRQELDEARLLNPAATIVLSGVLVHNEMDASGISKAWAQIDARFVVKRDGKVRFDKVKTARYEWESSFAGAVAIPKARDSYPVTVQKLLTELYADPDFIAALKK